MEYEAADLELVGGDASKLEAILGKYESERIKARQSVIDSTKAELRAYADLGLTPDQIKELKTAKPGESNADVEQRIQQAISEATTEINAKAAAKSRAAEVRAQAAELNFIKPTQALALLDHDALAKVKVDDNGDADASAVKQLLEDLAKDSPHLLKPTDHTPDHRSVGIGGTGSGTKPEVRPGVDRLRQAYADSSKK